MLSAFLNSFVFGQVRRMRKEEATRDLPASVMAAEAVRNNRKLVIMTAVFAAVFCVILGVVGLFIGLDLTWIMLATLIAAVVSVCSSLFLSPSMYVVLKG